MDKQRNIIPRHPSILKRSKAILYNANFHEIGNLVVSKANSIGGLIFCQPLKITEPFKKATKQSLKKAPEQCCYYSHPDITLYTGGF